MKKHDLEEDFPLSGGDEPNTGFGIGTLITMIIIIIGVACLIAHTKGLL